MIFSVLKAWANVYFAPPAANAMPVQVQAGQFAFYFRYPGPDGNFGALHPDLISESNGNFYGLDTDHDPNAKDDIVTAEMAIPVNREIHLLMHAKDVLRGPKRVPQQTIGVQLHQPLALLHIVLHRNVGAGIATALGAAGARVAVITQRMRQSLLM